MHGSSPQSLPAVFVCTGKDCSSRLTDRLCELLETAGVVERVGCQKICHGPVVGVHVDGELTWFEKVLSGKAEAALIAELVEPPVELPGSLAKRLVPKRTGKLRSKR
jgi:hypothetical protein